MFRVGIFFFFRFFLLRLFSVCCCSRCKNILWFLRWLFFHFFQNNKIYVSWRPPVNAKLTNVSHPVVIAIPSRIEWTMWKNSGLIYLWLVKLLGVARTHNLPLKVYHLSFSFGFFSSFYCDHAQMTRAQQTFQGMLNQWMLNRMQTKIWLMEVIQKWISKMVSIWIYLEIDALLLKFAHVRSSYRLLTLNHFYFVCKCILDTVYTRTLLPHMYTADVVI